MSLHLIDKKGKRIEIKSGERAPEGCSVDLEWYKAHGYVSAEETTSPDLYLCSVDCNTFHILIWVN